MMTRDPRSRMTPPEMSLAAGTTQLCGAEPADGPHRRARQADPSSVADFREVPCLLRPRSHPGASQVRGRAAAGARAGGYPDRRCPTRTRCGCAPSPTRPRPTTTSCYHLRPGPRPRPAAPPPRPASLTRRPGSQCPGGQCVGGQCVGGQCVGVHGDLTCSNRWIGCAGRRSRHRTSHISPGAAAKFPASISGISRPSAASAAPPRTRAASTPRGR